VAGRKVSPASIERVLAQHGAVRECLVFGLPSEDSDRTEVIAACVAAGTGVDADELKQFLVARLPAWQVPRKWWLVESLSAMRAANCRGGMAEAVCGTDGWPNGLTGTLGAVTMGAPLEVRRHGGRWYQQKGDE